MDATVTSRDIEYAQDQMELWKLWSKTRKEHRSRSERPCVCCECGYAHPTKTTSEKLWTCIFCCSEVIFNNPVIKRHRDRVMAQKKILKSLDRCKAEELKKLLVDKIRHDGDLLYMFKRSYLGHVVYTTQNEGTKRLVKITIETDSRGSDRE